jgi:hypothetical protein
MERCARAEQTAFNVATDATINGIGRGGFRRSRSSIRRSLSPPRSSIKPASTGSDRRDEERKIQQQRRSASLACHDMGREQRSRRHLSPDTLCYLCGQPIAPDESWNRDHVPPERIFGKRVRREHAVDLKWLPTHTARNSAYKADEEYFVVALVGHHHTPTARAVWDDVARGAGAGHSQGLIRAIIGQFGKVVLPDGTMVYGLDTARANRVAWKIVRGLYTLQSGRTLPESQLRTIEIVPQSEAAKRLPNHPWFAAVRDTEPLGHHGAVFDYKWLCFKFGESRGNAVAFLLWDGLIVLVLFHDPACQCDLCVSAASGDHERRSVESATDT